MASAGGMGSDDAVIKPIPNISFTIITESFKPLTHYKQGDWNVSINPIYYEIKQAFGNDPIVMAEKGQKLSGYGGGLALGYALSNTTSVYMIYTGVNMTGNMLTRKSEEKFFTEKITSDHAMHTLQIGLGYDLVDDKKNWSVPILFGLMAMNYHIDAKSSPTNFHLTTSSPQGELMDAPPYCHYTGDGTIIGGNIGIAVSRNFGDYIRITPYLLPGLFFSKPSITRTVTAENDVFKASSYYQPGGDMTGREDEVGNNFIEGYYGLGLKLDVLTGSNWSFSVNVGGLLYSYNLYNKLLLNELDMFSVQIAISYGTNFEKK